jgi:hypothetical protein
MQAAPQNREQRILRETVVLARSCKVGSAPLQVEGLRPVGVITFFYYCNTCLIGGADGAGG